ncbi:MAG: hypothetical protein Fur0024_4740 [Patescibacteria group bacterium]
MSDYEKVKEEIKKSRVCPFCSFNKLQIIKEFKHWIWIDNIYPYSLNHTMIIPKRHIKTIRSFNKDEFDEFDSLLLLIVGKYKRQLGRCLILMRDETEQQSVEHLHVHFLATDVILEKGIPRLRMEYNPSIFKKMI